MKTEKGFLDVPAPFITREDDSHDAVVSANGQIMRHYCVIKDAYVPGTHGEASLGLDSLGTLR